MTKKSFSTHLVELRKAAGYNDPAKAARAIGINYHTYLSYEKGKSSPTIENCAKIKEGFSVTFDRLFEPFIKPEDQGETDEEFENVVNMMLQFRHDPIVWDHVYSSFKFLTRGLEKELRARMMKGFAGTASSADQVSLHQKKP
jgi:DNA-binding XRE family transcriptional regulator